MFDHRHNASSGFSRCCSVGWQLQDEHGTSHLPNPKVVEMTYSIPSNKTIDPVKLDAWIQMNTVHEG